VPEIPCSSKTSSLQKAANGLCNIGTVEKTFIGDKLERFLRLQANSEALDLLKASSIFMRLFSFPTIL